MPPFASDLDMVHPRALPQMKSGAVPALVQAFSILLSDFVSRVRLESLSSVPLFLADNSRTTDDGFEHRGRLMRLFAKEVLDETQVQSSKPRTFIHVEHDNTENTKVPVASADRCLDVTRCS